MEFLKIAKRRSFWSEVAYVLLNVLLVVIVLVAVRQIGSPLPAFGLVLLSKWRVLAVRPRYWFAHIQSNLVDLIVSLSLVVFMYLASGSDVAQIIIAVLYLAWLLLLKPQSKQHFVVAQAGVALFVGTAATIMVSYDWYASVVVHFMWVIGYSTARHVLTAYRHGAHISFLSLLWGFMMAEMGWLTYHWAMAYQLPGVGTIQLPQASIIMIAFGFVAERMYASYIHHEKVRSQDVILPVLLSLSIVVILLVAFNAVRTSLL
jgi:hypothetical protein